MIPPVVLLFLVINVSADDGASVGVAEVIAVVAVVVVDVVVLGNRVFESTRLIFIL